MKSKEANNILTEERRQKIVAMMTEAYRQHDSTVEQGIEAAFSALLGLYDIVCNEEGEKIRYKTDKIGRVHNYSEHGAFKPIHGRYNTPEYISWAAMKRRCNTPKNKDYHNYGGRGISYDPRWNDFSVFFADLGHRPTKAHTLERFDPNGNYCPRNCTWATRTEQNRNRRCVKLTIQQARAIREIYSAGGATQRSLAAKFGVTQGAIMNIIHKRIWKDE